MAKGNFYRYFDDKADLVEAIVNPLATEIRAALRQCATALSRAAARSDVVAAYNALGFGLVSSVSAHPDVARLFLQEHRSPPSPARQSLHQLATEISFGAIRVSEVAIEHGLIRVKDPRVSALAVVGAVARLALAVLSGELDSPPAEIAEILVAVVLDGIRAPLN
jgi:AcrR family transcriptional regulator